MEREVLRRLVAEIQQSRFEPDAVEVKAAKGGTPKNVRDSLSAFANRAGGGVFLYGLDEEKGFELVGVGNCQKVQMEMTDWARDLMIPPVTLDFTVDEIDGKPVMAIEVQELPTALKPCYDKNKGLKGGAYLRAGGTDRSMTDYEIFGYVSSRGQPKDDEELIAEAGLDGLDGGSVDVYLEGLRRGRPNAAYLNGSRDEVLTRLHICGRSGEKLCPTLAGLLTFGKYPQEFFPQLRITYVQFHGTTEDQPAPNGARFVDNKTFEGAIPSMLAEVGHYLLSRIRMSPLIEGMFRRDIPEYPEVAIREVIANAIAHRDYSAFVRGTPIDVKLFADRLEVRSPGGLFGNVNLENIEEEHTTRNTRLMRILEDLRAVENRGSGIKAMVGALRDSNLEPPSFDDRRTSFLVTFRNHTLMNSDGVQWLNQYAKLPLNDRQRLALVYLRQHQRIGNADYRRLNRVDPLVAGQELHGLVEAELTVSEGVGRGTHYRLAVPSALPEATSPLSPDEDKILAYAAEHGSINNSQCRTLLEVNSERANYLLTKMVGIGRLRASGQGKGRKYLPA